LTNSNENPFEDKLPLNSDLRANFKYKDGLFRFLFSKNKEYALSLYNALNNSQYTNVDDLEFISLENAFFLRMINDTSFMFDKTLNLYEHQSTYNPNMPLRGLFYFADLYRKIIPRSELYTTKLLKIPTPKYVVFYNGEKELKSGDTEKLLLSTAFEVEPTDNDFEWTAIMININKNHSDSLMSKCKVLADYAQFVALVREYRCNNEPEDAILKAINECLKRGVLADFLEQYRWEICYLSWFDITVDEYRELVKKEADVIKAKAIAERDAAFAERDTAVAERDTAVAERDTAVAEKNAVIAERDAVLARIADLEAKLK
jgi:hypothetical protein